VFYTNKQLTIDCMTSPRIKIRKFRYDLSNIKPDGHQIVSIYYTLMCDPDIKLLKYLLKFFEILYLYKIIITYNGLALKY